MTTPVRVRFAPSPTGYLHLGSVRIALLNYMFAKKHGGTFILRIEDTDTSREVGDAKERILHDLAWLGLDFTEGPSKGGPYAPYLQSERNDIYQRHLATLIDKKLVYRCFCTQEELENKRLRQVAMGKPPRYERTCLKLTDDAINQKLEAQIPFVWRFKLDETKAVQIHDIARGDIRFELKNFADFSLTRHDGSCTFMFVNFVDDWQMNISHVVRGEDHLSNTALQAALYDAFGVTMPLFWHQQIICNKAGEKLSKRDFGFSLDDLRNAGYLPQAINNYMATVGVSLKEEFVSLDALIEAYNFHNPHHTGSIKYDVEKLNWFNHKWIGSLDLAELVSKVMPFISEKYPSIKQLDAKKLELLIAALRGEAQTLKDFESLVAFFFSAPHIKKEQLLNAAGSQAEKALLLIQNTLEACSNGSVAVESLKSAAHEHGLKIKDLFMPLRLACTGRTQGINLQEMIDLLGCDEVSARWSRALLRH